MPAPADRVALVTGTSTGIGLHTAVGLARAGLHVVATMRDPSRSDRLRQAATDAGVDVEVRRLDVTDAAGAETCVAEVLADRGRVDVLVNNAGQGHVATLEQLSDADLQGQLDVNYLGVARLTRLVLPTMRAAGRGRIVSVTSVGGAVGQPFADAYCGAKFAVEGLMQSLAPVAARFGIDVSVVEPAAVSSEFVSNIDPRLLDPGASPADDAADAYADLSKAYLDRTTATFARAQSPQDAAAVVVEAATTDSPRFRWQTSPTAHAFAGLSLSDLDGSRVIAETSSWVR
jgi:NAD(P)-dependent dehydrogenase (short-subunit alcohol dehydrogenase family)